MIDPIIDPKDKVKEFLKAYQEVAEKHKFDFYARIDISKNGGIQPSKQELDQIKKDIDRILFQYKVKMLPMMGLREVETFNSKQAEIADKLTKNGD